MITLIAAAQVAALSPQSCLANAPAVGADPVKAFPQAVDGTTVKNLKALSRLRKPDENRLLVIKGGDFTGQDARKLSLANICFIDTKLARTNWSGAQAPGLGFIRADLTGADLRGAQLTGLIIREATMTDVDATGASMAGGRLDGGWGGSLARLKLDNARLTGFQIICGTEEVNGCPFDRSGMSVRGTDFTSANLASFAFQGGSLDGAILDNTHVGVQQIGQLQSLVVRGPIVLHSPRRRVTLAPDDYLAVRSGIKLLSTAPPRPAQVDALACDTVTDRLGRAICAGGPELQALVEETSATPRSPEVAQQLATARAFCVNLSDDMIAGCLTRAYRTALTPVAVPVAGGAPVASNTIFASLPIRFTEPFKRSPIYTRVLPVLLDVAPTQVFAIVDARQRLSLMGGSQSGCRVNVSDLVYLPQSGWYGHVSGPTKRWRGKIIRPKVAPVVRFGAGGFEFDQAAQASALTCRPGGKLDPVVRLDAPPQFVELLAEPRTVSAGS